MVFGDGLWEEVRYKGGVLMNRMSALLRRGEEASWLSPPPEDVRGGQSEVQKRVIKRAQPCWNPDLGHSASRRVRFSVV